MKRFILCLILGALSISAEPSAEAEVGALISEAKDITAMVNVYRNYRGDNAKRRIVLQKIDSVFHANNAVYMNNGLQNEIERDLQSAEPQLVYQAIMTSGNLKIKGLKKAIIKDFLDADKISAGHASGIRQASMAALERIKDTSLAQVYLHMVSDRKDFWYDGDLLMALQGLAVHGDETCLTTVQELNNRFEGYLAAPGGESEEYHKTMVAELHEVSRKILTKLEEK